jgi:hypothetical protein
MRLFEIEDNVQDLFRGRADRFRDLESDRHYSSREASGLSAVTRSS